VRDRQMARRKREHTRLDEMLAGLRKEAKEQGFTRTELMKLIKKMRKERYEQELADRAGADPSADQPTTDN